ncbi:lipoyl domain-containing protein [Leptospira alexanderi]|uniref:lipoyl domain-containing protein n=1 Tax=Leptospira alexanderi TaxID=100053 RepID=UPI00028A1AFB|nr:lipoyl domain-containing protein [Leptospira alexanderi]
MESKSNIFELLTPDLGDTDKIELVHWNVKLGDSVEPGQEILELVTDKACFPMESPVKGRLTQIIKEKGSIVHKAEVLGILELFESE